MTWWKIYFWVSLVLSAIGLVGVYGQQPVWSFGAWLEVITSIVGLIGLFAFIYHKSIFSRTFWRVFFWIMAVSWVFSLIYIFTPLEEIFVLPKWLESQSITSETEFLLGILMGLPMVYAIYRLGQRDHKNRS